MHDLNGTDALAATDFDPGAAPVKPAPTEPTLDAVVAQIRTISSLPTVALQIMGIAADPESGAADLRAAVEADPALTARVMRSVNSAAFGLRRRLDHLAQAVSYLGFNRIRDLAVTATVSTLFRRGLRIPPYDRAVLWRHLVAVGVCSRMIAARTRVRGFEDAYLAGVLHDLGIILFDQYAHPRFRQVLSGLDGARSLREVERRFVPWDHTELGARVAEMWQLPEIVRVAMLHHHEPERYTGDHEAVLHCVAVANLVCSLKDLTSVGVNLVDLPPRSLAVLGLDRSDLQVLAEDLDAELADHRRLFDIQQGL